MDRHSRRRFLTNAGKPLRYRQISLIRCALELSAASRTRPIQWSTAFPPMLNGLRSPREGRIRRSMLPGFRFLFAAIVLSMSILVLGLGAAALLRAAHEEFASNPSWHALPEAMVAQQGKATRPVLAMLRVEPPQAEPKASEDAAAAVPATAPAVAEPAAIAPPPAEPEQVAALKPEEAAPAGAAKPDTPVAEGPAQSEAAAPAPADAPAAADDAKPATSAAAHDTKIVSAEPAAAEAPPTNEAAPATSEPAQSEPATLEPATSQPAASEQASTPASPQADVASATIVTLGGSPVTIETPPPATAAAAKPDTSAAEKRRRARRAAQRRRAAALARAERLAPQPANPFAQPFIQPATAAPSR
jgi:hypothetical protein